MSKPEEHSTPTILVTGCAGRLGRHVVRELLAAGFDLRTTDSAEITDCSDYVRADLRDYQQIAPLMSGIEVVIHLANHPGLKHPQTTFNENVSMNMNVFQGAAEAGVKRIVFASTLQLIGSHIDRRTVGNPPPMPSFPLNGETPATPANTYSLSKAVSEHVLQYYAERCGIDAVAIRYPLILENGIKDTQRSSKIDDTVIREGFAVISVADAARLVGCILNSRLPGYRVYSPGVSRRVLGLDNAALRREYYPQLQVTNEDLVDNSRITAETGWKPGN